MLVELLKCLESSLEVNSILAKALQKADLSALYAPPVFMVVGIMCS